MVGCISRIRRGRKENSIGWMGKYGQSWFQWIQESSLPVACVGSGDCLAYYWLGSCLFLFREGSVWVSEELSLSIILTSSAAFAELLLTWLYLVFILGSLNSRISGHIVTWYCGLHDFKGVASLVVVLGFLCTAMCSFLNSVMPFSFRNCLNSDVYFQAWTSVSSNPSSLACSQVS